MLTATGTHPIESCEATGLRRNHSTVTKTCIEKLQAHTYLTFGDGKVRVRFMQAMFLLSSVRLFCCLAVTKKGYPKGNNFFLKGEIISPFHK